MIDEFIDKYKLSDLEIIKVRGFVVSKTIELESIIHDLIISFLFDKGTREEVEIFNDFVVELPNPKRNMILKSTLLRLKQPMSEANTIVNDIAQIYKIRNAIAHWDWSFVSNEGDITLTKSTAKRPNRIISKEEMKEFCATFDRVRDKLNIIYFKELVDSGRMPKKIIKGKDF